MKLICAAFGLAAMCAVGLGAQSGSITTTKVDVKDGKDVTVSGCLAHNPGGGFMLTNSSGGLMYALVSDEDMSQHIGHQLEVNGTATDQGSGRIEITSVTTGANANSEAKTEAKGDLAGMHYLGVKSVKMLNGVCK